MPAVGAHAGITILPLFSQVLVISVCFYLKMKSYMNAVSYFDGFFDFCSIGNAIVLSFSCPLISGINESFDNISYSRGI